MNRRLTGLLLPHMAAEVSPPLDSSATVMRVAWFRRSGKDRSDEQGDPTPIADVDWANREVVLAEWRDDPEAPDWGAAMEMFDEGRLPVQRFNVAEYLTRRLKLALFDRSTMPDDLTAEVCRRVLIILSEIPTEPLWMADLHRKFGPRLIRLPLALIRDRGWQPVRYGGDETVRVDLDVAPIASAVATTHAPDGEYLRYFFGCS